MGTVRTSDGVDLHVEVLGPPAAAPLVMVMGLGSDRHGWIAQRLPFALRHRTIAIDNRGVGRSTLPEGAEVSLERMALDVVEVLDHLGVERARVMGASMGGIVAQVLAVLHPERVSALVLACTACEHTSWRRELLEQWIDEVEAEGMAPFVVRNSRWLLGPRSLRRLWPALGVLSPIAMSAPAEVFVAQARALLDADDELRFALPSIAVPTLVVVGSQDILTPQVDSELLFELIPGSELAIVRGAAHGFFVEHARTFNRTVLRFLDRVRRAEVAGGGARPGTVARSAT